MERTNNHQQHTGGSGFLLGVIVGVLLTLLFTTKRGRAILKEVMEKGIQKFADLEELMREMEEKETSTEEDEDYEDENDYIPAKQIAAPEPPKKEVVKKAEPAPEPKVKEEPKPEPEPEPEIEDIPTLEEPEVAAELQKEELKPPAPPKEEKQKATPVKRLFRGLRRKS